MSNLSVLGKNRRDESLYPLVINSTHLVPNADNSRFRYQFPVGSAVFTGAKIAVSSVSVYYSWFNISASLGNNTYQFIWTDGSGSATYTVTMPDGFYTVSELNSYLQFVCVTNGLYLVDGSGNYVYYLEFVENPSRYAVGFNSYPFPTALPAGYTNPSGLLFPAVASTPQLVIQNNDFQNIIGFTAGTYPTAIQATNYSVISSFTPQITPIQSVILACNLVNNQYSNPPTVIYSFSPSNTQFGSLINSAPNELAFIDIQDGIYANIDVQFLDQTFQPISLNDTNLVIILLVKETRSTF